MTFLPAIIVLAIVFLSFSKKTLATPEKPRERMDSIPGISDALIARGRDSDALLKSDALRKYELLRGLDRNI